jgi:hypothetical protein
VIIVTPVAKEPIAALKASGDTAGAMPDSYHGAIADRRPERNRLPRDGGAGQWASS